MENINFLDVIFLFSAIASIVLAITAISAANKSAKEVRDNFEKTQSMMVNYESRIKDLLSEINTKSAIIEKTVSESQQSLMGTMTNIINETVLPKKVDAGEQAAIQMINKLMENPGQSEDFIKLIDSMNKLK